VTIAGNTFHALARGIYYVVGPHAAITTEHNIFYQVTTPILNPGGSGVLLAKQVAFSVVQTLAGGATTETTLVALPVGTFAAKPEACFAQGIDPANQQITGWYNYTHGSASSTVAAFLLGRNDVAANLSAGAVRLAVACFGTGYAQN